MAIFQWSNVQNYQVLASTDTLNFDDSTISAGIVGVGWGYSSFTLGNSTASPTTWSSVSYYGKTVYWAIDVKALTEMSVTFSNGSKLLIGDNTAGITADDSATALTGGTGNDQLLGLGGNDTLTGGAGDDVFFTGYSSNSFGTDTVSGDAGNDWIIFNSNATAAATVNLSTRFASSTQGSINFTSIERVSGTSAGDTFTGGDTTHATDSLGNRTSEVFRGMGGNDTLIGAAGNDYLTAADYSKSSNPVVGSLQTGVVQDGMGGTDSLQNVDMLTGGSGNDALSGGSQSRDPAGYFYEIFRGMAGNDTIDGGAQGTGGVSNTLNATFSHDRADYSTNTATQAVQVNLATGVASDGILVNNVAGTDQLIGINQVYGGAGNDAFTGSWQRDTFDGGAGNDTLNGGQGNDIARYAQSTNGVIVNLSSTDLTINPATYAVTGLSVSKTVTSQTAFDGLGGTDTLISMEGVWGSDYADYIRGSDDTSVRQTFVGGGGNDTIDGGAGIDLASYTDVPLSFGGINANMTTVVSGYIQVTDKQGGVDKLVNIEGIAGTNSNDTLVGNANDNTFYGSGGSDSIDGGAGSDWVTYLRDPGAVSVNLSTGRAQDGWAGPLGLINLAGNDTLVNIENVEGSDFNDTLTGSSGNNLFRGGLGNDSIVGNGGSDSAYYSGPLARYSIKLNSGGTVTVTDTMSSDPTYNLTTGEYEMGDGTDTLSGISSLVFSDKTLYLGTSGNDSMTGTSAADAFMGFAGVDTMAGGAGDDVYYVDNSSDVVQESASSGSDTLITTVGVTLPDNVENLSIAANATGYSYSGNSLDNTVYVAKGTQGYINGGMGNDTLVVAAKFSDHWFTINTDGSLNMWDGVGGRTVANFERLVFEDKTLNAMPVMATGVDLNGVLRSGSYDDHDVGPNRFWRNGDGSFGATLPYRVAGNGEVSLGGDINLMRISLGKPQGTGLSLSLGTSSTLSFSVPGTGNPNQTVSSTWQEVPGVSNLEASLSLRSGTSTYDLLVRQKSGINASDADFVNALRSLQLNALVAQEVVRQDVTLSVDISSNNGSTWVGANSTQLGSEVFHFSGPAPSAQWARFGKSEVYIGLETGADAGGIQNLASRGDTNQGTPSPSLFTVTVNGVRAQVLEVTVDHGLRLALDRELNVTDIVTVTYSSPALEQRLNVLQDRQGNDIASFSLQAQSDVLRDTGVLGTIGFPGGWDTRPDFERQLYDKVFGPGGSDLSFRISQVNATTHEYSLAGVGTFVPNSALDPALVPGYSTSMYTRERLEIVGGNAPTNWVSGQSITVQELLMSGLTARQFTDWLELSSDGVTTATSVQITQMQVGAGVAPTSMVSLLSLARVDTTGEYAFMGNDSLTGGAGSDYLMSSTGNDTVNGMGGNDSILGGAGDDSIDGGAGIDTAVYSGRRADYVVTADTAGQVTVRDMRHMPGQYATSPEGTDTLTNVEFLQFSDGTVSTTGLPQSTGINVVVGNAGNNFFTQTAGNDYFDGGIDSFSFIQPLAPNDTDTLDYSASTGPVSINAKLGTVTGDASVGQDTFHGIENFTGSAYSDAFIGTGVERVSPGRGNDTIDAGVSPSRSNYGRNFTVNYTDAGSAITLNYTSATTATVTSATDGTDTVVLSNLIMGSEYGDSINVSLYGGTQPFLGGGLNGHGTMRVSLGGGNDTLVGSGFGTLLTYVYGWSPDTNGVSVNLTQGWVDATHLKLTPTSAVNFGMDTFSGVSGVFGSNYNDTLVGGTTNADVLRYRENFQGGGGDDSIDGGAGLDVAFASGYVWTDWTSGTTMGTGVGVVVDLAAGTMVTASDPIVSGYRYGIANGSDILRSVEAVSGTQYSDTYTATNFGSTSVNVGSLGAYNKFFAFAGNDTITGNGATELDYFGVSSSMNADLGAGRVWGDEQTGLDVINGGVFAVDGGQGDDVLIGGGQGRMDEPRLHYEFFMGNGGNDLIDGRGGWDIASYMNDTAGISVDMTKSGSQVTDGAGNRDTLISVEEIQGSAFADTMLGTANTAGLEFNTVGFMGLEGNDTLDGNGGPALAIYSRDKAAVTVNLSTGTATDGWGGTDTLRTIMGVVGSAYGDTLTGSASGNVFEGRGGNDSITGGGGADFAMYRNSQAAVNVNLAAGSAQDGWGGTDTLVNINGVYGSVFADTLTGGSGNDTLVGEAGNDTLTGGGGADEARFSGPMARYTWTAGSSAGTVIVTDSLSSTPSFDSSTGSWSVGDGTDTLVNISKLVFSDSVLLLGTSGADSMTGSSGADALDGLSGADTLVGGLGNDTYYVDNASDQVTEAAGAGIDTVIASVGYTLPDNVENLTLRGTGNWGSYTGNALDNTVVVANGVNASINAGSGNDTLVRSGNYADYWMGLNPDGSVSMWDNTAGISASGFEKLVFADRTIAVPQIGVGVDLNGVFNPDTINHDRIGPNVWWRNSDGSNGTNLTTSVASNAELNLGGLINQMRISLPKPTGSGLSFTLGYDTTKLTLVAPGTGGTAVLDSTWRDVPGMGNVEAQISPRAGSSTYDLLVRQKAGIDASDADFMNALRSLQVGMLNTADATVQDIPITVDISSNGGSTWLGASAGQLGTTTLRLDGTANAPVWSSFSKREIAIGFGEALDGAYNDEWNLRNAGTPSSSLFKVTVNGTTAQVLEVKIDSGLQLTLDRSISTTDVVVVSYASPAGDQRLNVLQDRSGNDVASFQLTVSAETSSTSTALTGITGTIYYPGGLNVNTDLGGRNVDQLSGGGDTASIVVTGVQSNGNFTASIFGTWMPNTVLDPVTSPGFQPGMVTRSKLDISGTGAPSTWKAGTTFTGDAIWPALQSSGASLTTWEDWVQGSQDGSTVSFSQQLDAITVATGAQVFIPRLLDGVMGYFMNFGADTLVGAAGNDSITGLRGNDSIQGGAGDDVLIGGGGPDTIDGGSGNDTAVYSGRRADYLITTDGTGVVTVRDMRHLPGQFTNSPESTDTLSNVENLQFSDRTITTSGLPQATNVNVLAGTTGWSDYFSPTSTSVNYVDGGWDNAGPLHPLANDTDTLNYSSYTAAVAINTADGTVKSTASPGVDRFRGIERFTGTAFDDTFVGGNPDVWYEVFTPGAGNDTIDAGVASTRMSQRTFGVDYLNAGSGITLTYTSDKQATVTSSTDGTDTLGLANYIVGSAYADSINVSQYGGAKPYLGGGLNGYGSLRVMMGDGNDTLIGNGYTRLEYSNAYAPDSVGLVVNLTAGTVDATRMNGGVDTFSGVNGVFGSNANDTLLGGTTSTDGLRYREYFVGNAGDDSINGGSGLDIVGASGYFWVDSSTNLAVGKGVGVDVDLAAGTMSNAADNNAIGAYTYRFGGFNGTDTLRSVEGVFGTQYNDTYTATGFGSSSVNAGSLGAFNLFTPVAGNDTITGNGATELDYSSVLSSMNADLSAGRVWGDVQTGLDVINSGVFAVDGGQGDDVLTGGGQGRLDEPRSHHELFMGNGGNDLIDGRGGWDIASYMNDTGAISVDLSKWGSQVTDGGGNRDTLISVEQIEGSAFADTMTGTSNTSGLEFGTLGFMGLEGNDTIDGNGGVVYAMYNRDKAAVTVNLSAGTATDGWGGTDTLRNITAVVGSAFGDTLTGNASSNVFEGRGGNDTITGGGGADFAAYRDSQKSVNVNLAAGSAQDGWDTTDTLINISGVYGSVFGDTLTGSSGNDTLVGGGGNDTIDGGSGNDEVRYSGPIERYNIVSTGVNSYVVTDTLSSTPVFDASTGRWSWGEGSDTLTGIEKLVFNNAVSPSLPSLQGQAYFWNYEPGKGHAMLGGVKVAEIGGTSVTNNFVSVKNVSWSPDGHVTAEVWIRSNSAVNSYDVDLAFDQSLSNLQFVQSATPSGFLATNYFNPSTNHLKAAGVGINPYAAGGFKLADISFDVASSLNTVSGHLVMGKVNDVAGDTWDATMSRTDTASNGTYAFYNLSAGNYTVQATRAATDTGAAVSAQDALAALKLAVNLNPNTDPDGTGPQTPVAASPYQFIAADVAGAAGNTPDGKVTSMDALAILKMAVGMPVSQAPAASWVMLPETSVLSGINKDNVTWDSSTSATVSGSSAAKVNFVGVLKGDVNGSWSAPAGSALVESIDPTYFSKLAATLSVPASQWQVI